MIITYLRSSSYNTWDFCNHKFFLDYTLGWRSPANKKASKGTIVHKSLELLAQYKLAKQQYKDSFTNDELGKFFLTEISPDICIELAFHHIAKLEPHYDWDDDDFAEVKKWMWVALNYRDGMFNPLKQDVVQPEQYFDITFEDSWAHYDYKLPDGNNLKGQLGMKGTLDLIAKLDKNTYELIDYKTGKRMDWNTGEEKTYDKLCKDPQLRMYHYAASRLFPEIEQIIVTIFYISDGGAISMNFTPDDLKATEEMIRKRFNLIRNTFKPKKIYPNWKCTKLCYFGKHDIEGKPIGKDDYKEKSACTVIGKDLLTLGMDRVMLKHSKSDVTEYGSGGGRSANKPED